MKQPIIWDAHVCFGLGTNADLEGIEFYLQQGVSHIGISVGMDQNTFEDIILTIAQLTKQIKDHPKLALVEGYDFDFEGHWSKGILTISYNLEGAIPLLQNLNMVNLFFDLGVRQILFAYNVNNEVSGGCLAKEEQGLSEFGRTLVKRMNDLGMVIDLTHISETAALEIMDLSKCPCIFSHSNPKLKNDHKRNISDQLIEKCANSGGVIGINGIGSFLGDRQASSKSLVEHATYVADMVGQEHVGFGLDSENDPSATETFFANNPQVAPNPGVTPEAERMKIAGPNQWGEIATLFGTMQERRKAMILGENWLRVFRAHGL